MPGPQQHANGLHGSGNVRTNRVHYFILKNRNNEVNFDSLN